MKLLLPRRTLVILLATVLLIVVIQLLRLNLIMSYQSLDHTLANTYDPAGVQKLAQIQLDGYHRPSCLIIGQSSEQVYIDQALAMLRILQTDCETLVIPGEWPDLASFDLVMVIGQNRQFESRFDDLAGYAAEDGRLFYWRTGSPAAEDSLVRHAAFFGIQSFSMPSGLDRLDFRTELLSGLAGEWFADGSHDWLNMLFAPLGARLQASCTVHLSGGQDLPVVWEITDGRRLMVMDTGPTDARRVRGLLTGALSVFLGTAVYPVTRSAVWQIVNLPVDETYEHPVLSGHYRRNFSQYILDLWWNDLSALMRRYAMRMTAAFLPVQGGGSQGQDETLQVSTARMNILVGDLLRQQGELSIQAGPWQPDGQSGSQPQGGGQLADPSAAMLQAGLNAMRELLPNYSIRTCVAPGIRLSDEDRRALKAAMPDLAIISSAYFADLSDSGNSALTPCMDFTADQLDGVAFPHVTSGPFFDGLQRYDLASAVTTHGLISHMIAADEILSPDRSRGLLWEDMARSYGQMFSQTDQLYGWLYQDTVSEAAERLRQTLDLALYYRDNGQTIEIACDRLGREANLIVVSSRPVTGSTGCTFRQIDSIRYLVTMHENRAVLEVGPR